MGAPALRFALVAYLCCVAVRALEQVQTPRAFEFKHHNNYELNKELERVNQECPSITLLYELNYRSVKGWPLTVIEFSGNPGVHDPLEPEFKYIANMHGNEVLGRELVLALADDLCKKYNAGDPEVRRLINTTRIHLMPSMNPDGWDFATEAKRDWLSGRNNANNVDLNRDFPDLDKKFQDIRKKDPNAGAHHLFDGQLEHAIQPETRAVIEWIISKPFVLSANLHGGALVANYPFDDTGDDALRRYTAAPDDDVFKQLSRVYADNHEDMHQGKPCNVNELGFENTNGITNGAAWYSVKGGMQDFNYLSSNDFEITLELGCEKYPPASALQAEWERNRRSLYELLWRTHQGIKGYIVDASTNQPIANAEITVYSIKDGVPSRLKHDVASTKIGEFWRILLPGYYTVQASAPGYESQRVTLTVSPFNKNAEATRVDFKLQPSEVTVSSPEESADPDKESLDILALIASEARKMHHREEIPEDN